MAGKWDEEGFKESVRSAYLDSDPSPKTNAEILKQLGEDFDVSPNSIRVFLTRENVYVAEKPSEASSDKETKPTGGKRISKEAAISALKAKIAASGKTIDNEIIDKLTGKAALYFAELL